MASYICKIKDLGELIKNMQRLAEGMRATFDYDPELVLKLKGYPRIKWYYYCDNLWGNTIRLYDSEFYERFGTLRELNKLYVEPKKYVILRGHDLGKEYETLKQNIRRSLFESLDGKPPKGINTNHPKDCLSFFEKLNNGDI